MSLTIKEAKKLYRDMLLIRRFEEKAAELYTEEKIRGFLHLYIGEEAVATGIMATLKPEDGVVATYREHGHALVKGIEPQKVMAELYGKIDGCSRGRGGSMHLFDKEKNFYGGYAIVGGGLPLAVGIALADKRLGRERVTVCFFGDGAVAEGEFHESLNLAALWNLPVLFVCENNLYGMGTRLELAESEPDIAKKAESYRIESHRVDGMDVLKVHEAARKALSHVRSGKGPVFLECQTYRFRAHSMFDAELYRSKEEVEEWKKKDPLLVFRKRSEELEIWEKIGADAIEKEVEKIIADAVDFAEKSGWEPVDELTKYVYSEEVPS
ncbi:pyruvate dehydrogenase (acetyl-transferring) E1 component subunit alpha [Hydrogenimonas cancrithermarum]|uniref:Pyruvate dehydrogenase E1 component subunit alpha n=1 Tax=Hydrogenimonas cancrithermarum TaxID=2993563 RepID=A0ABN6WRG8_9BACT|nr:pyruvate dehydrogenase (acetyl-transferring) E1 component subunit alpha [Hydrogenimonas cancrithermarum]BDY11750.1 pyruvate dehydrogenase E1 component subunit alpha [Hydrogenimonas cancrithermarum]